MRDPSKHVTFGGVEVREISARVRSEEALREEPRREDPIPEFQDPPKETNNTMYILIGLVFIGAAVWLGEDSSHNVMPYY